MSTTNDLVCHDCKVKLWTGQSCHIYTGAEYITDLEKFLFDHQHHKLEFTDEHNDMVLYYENVPTHDSPGQRPNVP